MNMAINDIINMTINWTAVHETKHYYLKKIVSFIQINVVQRSHLIYS